MRVNFSFRYQAPADSKYGVLLSYVTQDAPDMTRTERILQSFAAFWLPFAYREHDSLSESELSQLARQAISLLEYQIRRIEGEFALSSHPPPLSYDYDAETSAAPESTTWPDEHDILENL